MKVLKKIKQFFGEILKDYPNGGCSAYMPVKILPVKSGGGGSYYDGDIIKTKPIKLWAITHFDGSINVGTISHTRQEAIEKYLSIWCEENAPQMKKWKYWYGKGLRAVRVNIYKVVS